jgi:hypothetical protein
MRYPLWSVTISIARTACKSHQAPWSRAFQLRLSFKHFCVLNSLGVGLLWQTRIVAIFYHASLRLLLWRMNYLTVVKLYVSSVKTTDAVSREKYIKLKQVWIKGVRVFRENTNMKILRCKFVIKICFFTTVRSRMFFGGFGFSTSVFTAFPLCVWGCSSPPLTGATTYPRHQVHLSRVQRTLTNFPLFSDTFLRHQSDGAQTLYRILRLLRIIFFFRLTYYWLMQKL